MKERIYQMIIVIMSFLLIIFFVEEGRNYSELLSVNSDLTKLVEENQETYNSTYESMNKIIEELKSENFRLNQELEKLKPTYTEEELETFAHLLYAEAGGESDTCIMYVGSVVLNRVTSENYPNTLLEVIYQNGQYEPIRKGFMQVEVKNPNCYKIAKFLLENGSMLPSEVLGQADYSIYSKYGSKLYDSIDGIYFFYLREES